MNIVILGAGILGAYVASVLSQEEHNVILIDKDPDKLERVGRKIDVATIQGVGSNWQMFEDLIENEPHLFIAMTGDDESNLTSCLIAKNLGYPKTICRIKDIGYLNRTRLDFGRLFFVDHFIGAEVLAAHDVLKNIMNPSDLAIENFAHGMIQMRTIILPHDWARGDIPVKDLSLPEEMIIGMVRRKDPKEGKDIIIFPHGNDKILPQDEITVIGETKVMYNLHEVFGTPQKDLQQVVIVGGSAVGLHLARFLEKQRVSIKLLEVEEARCQQLAQQLHQTTIINHDGKDLHYLASEKVQEADAFISCSKHDDTNMLVAALGKRVGCKKAIALISDASLIPILRELEITSSVSEQVNIANRILSIVHAETIISISSLADNQARVTEIKVSADSEVVGIPIFDLSAHLPKDLLIAVIENKGRVMVGKGNRILSPNDTIIVISAPKHIHEFQYLF